MSENNDLYFAPRLSGAVSVCKNILCLMLFLCFMACSTLKEPETETIPWQEDITQPATLTFWHTFNDDETLTLQTILQDFHQEFPHLQVKVQQVPFSDALNKYKTVAQAEQAPDVFRAEIAWTADLASMGYLMALDTFLSKEVQADYLPQAMAYNRYRGHIWGIPQVTDCLALLYNKQKLREHPPPETLDDLIQLSKALTNPEKQEYGFFYRGDPYWFIPFVWAFGGQLIDLKTLEVKIAEKPAIQALEYLIALRKEHQIVPKVIDFANDYDNQQIGFKTGKYAMIINGPWSTADILSGAEFKNQPHNLGITRIPKGPGGYGSPVGGQNYVISANTKHLVASWILINYLNRPKNQARFALRNNLLPTRLSTYQLPDIKANRIIQKFKYVLDVANIRPVIPQGGALFVDLKPAYQAALLYEKTPESALKEVAEAWKVLLTTD